MAVAMDVDGKEAQEEDNNIEIDSLPNQTLYINNLNERIRQEEMKKALYAVFSQFGSVIDIVVMKTFRLRGQAWIVYDDITMSTAAMRAMNGFNIFDKQMRVAYAKTKSDAISKREGTFHPRDRSAQAVYNREQRDKLENRTQRKIQKEAAMIQQQNTQQQLNSDMNSQPHYILFVEALPKAATADMVSTLFQQFPGFKEVRMIAAKPGIAFVEFESAIQAGVALQGLQGFKITQDNSIIISFAKK